MLSYKISIIIPAFNEEKNILNILDSAYNQTYKNFEVIVVDDGSQDKTGNICQKYKKDRSNLKYIYKKNSGVSETRNLGLNYATGDYICFWDADDWVDSNYLSEMMDSISLTPRPKKTILVAGCTVEHYHRNVKSITEVCTLDTKLISKDLILKSFNNDHESYRLELWNKLFPKEIIHDKKFKSRYVLGEDFEFFTQCLQDISYLLTVDNVSYHYKVDDSQLKHYTKFINEINRERDIAKNLIDSNVSKDDVGLFYYRRLLITAYTSLSYLKCDTKEKKNEVDFILKELKSEKNRYFRPFARYQKAQKIMQLLTKLQSPFVTKEYFELKRKLKHI